MSSMLAGPLTDHCFTTVAHSGTPKGESITIAGVPTYLSAPQSESTASDVKTVILYFSDVFGPFYINAQLIQDYYALQGTSACVRTFVGLLIGQQVSQWSG